MENTSKICWISEPLCIGCSICVKKCPYDAISIINLPKDLSSDTTHRFSANSFKLHRLPCPRAGEVLGLVGTNGIGKSTALKVLAGKLKPNLGRFDAPPEWKQILEYFRGSELQTYFTRLLEDRMKALVKPQYVDHIPRQVQGKVGDILRKKNESGNLDDMVRELELGHLLEREVSQLSGGELQRFAICVVCIQDGDIYMFDEPSSYLDVKQRLAAGRCIRSVLTPQKYVIVVEHDLSVLDYLSDFVCCLWGQPSVFGVVTMPFSVREGINIFLDGFIPTENLRTREESLNFKIFQDLDNDLEKMHSTTYPDMVKKQGDFKLTVESGTFSDSEIVVMLGQNGCGKTTFIRMLAGYLQPDNTSEEMPQLSVSYKPQAISPKFEGSVRDLFLTKIREGWMHAQFQSDVVKPMQVESLLDLSVQTLSGGELQRVALIIALGKPADVYLIDEPSAYLDSEQRIVVSRVIKRFILNAKKTAFIVEHDFIMATYLADRVIVYDGQPGVDCVARSPESLLTGMNKFLKGLDITFRRDPTNFRPRINKHQSIKDKEQKLEGQYFQIDH